MSKYRIFGYIYPHLLCMTISIGAHFRSFSCDTYSCEVLWECKHDHFFVMCTLLFSKSPFISNENETVEGCWRYDRASEDSIGCFSHSRVSTSIHFYFYFLTFAHLVHKTAYLGLVFLNLHFLHYPLHSSCSKAETNLSSFIVNIL